MWNPKTSRPRSWGRSAEPWMDDAWAVARCRTFERHDFWRERKKFTHIDTIFTIFWGVKERQKNVLLLLPIQFFKRLILMTTWPHNNAISFWKKMKKKWLKSTTAKILHAQGLNRWITGEPEQACCWQNGKKKSLSSKQAIAEMRPRRFLPLLHLYKSCLFLWRWRQRFGRTDSSCLVNYRISRWQGRRRMEYWPWMASRVTSSTTTMTTRCLETFWSFVKPTSKLDEKKSNETSDPFLFIVSRRNLGNGGLRSGLPLGPVWMKAQLLSGCCFGKRPGVNPGY